MRRAPNLVTVAAVGTTVTAGATTARVAIPVAASGDAPMVVRIVATGFVYVKPGSSTVTATINDRLVSPYQVEVLGVGGCTNIAYIQETPGSKINICPLETA